MTIEDAWLAGIIEGEGCITTKWRPKRKTKLRLSISMTDEDVIARVASLLGSSYWENPRPNGCKMQYATEVSGINAIKVLERIKPLLGKRRLARLAQLESTL